ncbi:MULTISPECIES: pyrroline-5-carboxylate reductase family protein [Rhizobium]|nr:MULTISPECIES: pyrroline-5-carboxylate reductase dimerization domain-containing protein [Rhizobium]NKL49616.1 pyrroline-5-carboxylate reductase [Rhizobium leguminosarum bv. viciae]MBX4937041.1 NAD(P)-binding domain-containing protein [Rhizobium binae]MBX4943691.1 NAD(P)-binding domain-containing protein [Rhizobium binae]MBX4979135.1 NAD(P)-binding domain-containing protein [Rhizobium binae]MBX4995872.1 NAD(P)-binding domain-containing protein [Rhizobium binae]
MSKIGIIGASGWLGSSLAQGLVDAGVANPQDLILSYRSRKPNILPDAVWTLDNKLLAEEAAVVIVSVQPGDFPSVDIAIGGKLAISVMAGINLAALSRHLGTDRVVRSLPNAAAEVRQSYTPWVASPKVTDEDRALLRRIAGAWGEADELRFELDLDYFTGLTGSGPAFPALLARAMARDAVARGIDPAIARKAVVAVLKGAGALFERTSDAPEDVVRRFVDYKGTTSAALEAMIAGNFERAVSNGLEAALARSYVLGSSEGKVD